MQIIIDTDKEICYNKIFGNVTELTISSPRRFGTGIFCTILQALQECLYGLG